jgi:hypothetical protein
MSAVGGGGGGATGTSGGLGLSEPGKFPLVCVTKLNPQISQKFTPAAGTGALQSGQTLSPAPLLGAVAMGAELWILAPHSEQKSLSADECPLGQMKVLAIGLCSIDFSS